MTLLVILVLFVLLDLVAVRFGADSRDGGGWSRHDPDELGYPQRS